MIDSEAVCKSGSRSSSPKVHNWSTSQNTLCRCCTAASTLFLFFSVFNAQSCKPSPARNAAAAILATLVGRQGQPESAQESQRRRQVDKERGARVDIRGATRDASSTGTVADTPHGADRNTTNTTNSRVALDEVTCSKNGKARGGAVTPAEGLPPRREAGVLDRNAGRGDIEGEECPSPSTSASAASPASSTTSSHPERDRCDHATPARGTRRRVQQRAESTTRDTRSTRCLTLTPVASAGCDSAGSSSSRRRTPRTSPRARPPKLRESARGEDGQLGSVGKGVTPPGKSVPGKGYEPEAGAESVAEDGTAIGSAQPLSKENLGVAGETGLMSPSGSSPRGSLERAGPRDEYSYKFANYCRKDKVCVCMWLSSRPHKSRLAPRFYNIRVGLQRPVEVMNSARGGT